MCKELLCVFQESGLTLVGVSDERNSLSLPSRFAVASGFSSDLRGVRSWEQLRRNVSHCLVGMDTEPAQNVLGEDG